jgi:hypothetical protein
MNNTLTGLASSLLLNVGLTRIAEKLDPIQAQAGEASAARQPVEACTFPTNFSPDLGQ